MAIDYSTPLGKLRALIPDVEEVDWEDTGEVSYLFTDEQLQAYLSLHSETSPGIHRAAADAVGALATSEALISKVIKTEDLQTDGAKVANALLLRAQRLREHADDEERKEDESAFDIVDFTPLPRIIWPR